jgi:uncharacterized protein
VPESAFPKVLRLCLGLALAFGSYSLPQAIPQASPFKVLAFYVPYAQMGDAAHAAYSLEANTWFPKVAAANGFTYESTTDWSKINAANLVNYKVIMFLDNMPWDGNQRTAFKNYMDNGGGWVGFHVCAFNQNPADWDWYFNQFLAMGSYKNNTWAPTTAVLTVEDTSHFITKGFPKKFTAPVNEWYGWNNDLRQNADIKVLCSIHDDSYPLGTGTGSGGSSEIWQKGSGYHPIIWTNKKYKMLYSNIGHDDVNYSTRVGLTKTFDTLQYAKLVLNAIKYCAGITTGIDDNSQITRKTFTAIPGSEITSDNDFIHFRSMIHDKITVTMSDTKGRMLNKTVGMGGTCSLNRTGISSGAYILNVTAGSLNQSRIICIK